ANRAEHVARVSPAEFEAALTEARQYNRPVRVEDILRKVMRAQQLKPLRRNMDISWRDEVVDIFRVDHTGDGPALQVWQAALRLGAEEKFTLILALLADEFGGGTPYCLFHPYRRLLLRLLEADDPTEGDLMMAVLHRLHEVPPYKRKSYFDRMARDRIS